MRKIIIGLVAVILVLGILCLIEVKRHSTPWVRGGVAIPVFTVGDESFARDLAKGKKVVKYGPMFFGLYRGGPAFAMVEDAANYLRSENKDLSKWGVFVLSGDFLLDVNKYGDKHYIKKTLLVINQAEVQ